MQGVQKLFTQDQENDQGNLDEGDVYLKDVFEDDSELFSDEDLDAFIDSLAANDDINSEDFGLEEAWLDEVDSSDFIIY